MFKIAVSLNGFAIGFQIPDNTLKKQIKKDIRQLKKDIRTAKKHNRKLAKLP